MGKEYLSFGFHITILRDISASIELYQAIADLHKRHLHGHDSAGEIPQTSRPWWVSPTQGLPRNGTMA
jgi:hypothetical protein